MDAPAQLSLSFEPGLTTRYRTLEDCCAAVVYSFRGGLESVAAHLDMSPSELSRRLNAHAHGREGEHASNRPLRIADLSGILDATGDLRPIYWLIEKYLRDPEAQRAQAIAQLAAMLPQVEALLEQSGAPALRSVRK